MRTAVLAAALGLAAGGTLIAGGGAYAQLRPGSDTTQMSPRMPGQTPTVARSIFADSGVVEVQCVVWPAPGPDDVQAYTEEGEQRVPSGASVAWTQYRCADGRTQGCARRGGAVQTGITTLSSSLPVGWSNRRVIDHTPSTADGGCSAIARWDTRDHSNDPVAPQRGPVVRRPGDVHAPGPLPGPMRNGGGQVRR